MALPTVLLHDHLDGGLRPNTVLELAEESGYSRLPTQDPDALAEWFDQSQSGSLEAYLAASRIAPEADLTIWPENAVSSSEFRPCSAVRRSMFRRIARSYMWRYAHRAVR